MARALAAVVQRAAAATAAATASTGGVQGQGGSNPLAAATAIGLGMSEL
jgi:hypothetical protein